MILRADIILWDFDGVILNSNKIRDEGFKEVLSDYPVDEVNQLLDFHRKNGGLSRYVKFKYFFETIRCEKVSNETLDNCFKSFTEIMRSRLINPDLLIKDSLEFIERYFDSVEMHVVSGSDQQELRELCSVLNLENYFKSINGSPTPKNILVKNLMDNLNSSKEVVLIGDSINDYEAAKVNAISFFGYNNLDLMKICNLNYISSFDLVECH